MKIELKDAKSYIEIEHGDIILLNNGSQYLIIADSDMNEYRGAVNMANMRSFNSEYYSNVKHLINDIEGIESATVERIVKAKNLVLKEV